jgi:Alginate export
MRELRPKRFTLRLVAAWAALGCAGAGAQQGEEPFGIADSISRGRFTLELRPRYNRIDESDKPLRTEGGTVRLVAGIETAPLQMTRVVLEGIHANHLDPHFNVDPANINSSPYPLLPDPRYTGFNRVYLEYQGLEDARIRAGRQRVRLDNQRWISDNDFRQVPQLFDGAQAVYTGLANAELYAAYFGRVRNTSGVTNELDLTLLHAAWNPAPAHYLSAYAYFHDQAQNGAFTGFANNSYRVIGIRWVGSAARWLGWSAVDLPFEAEFATQRAHAGGDARIDANYWRVGGGIAWRETVARVDYEVKESNDGRYAVQMPLTDFYAFNGWTLHFYNTPRQGLRDGWATLRQGWRDFTLFAEYHRFRSDFGGIGFGRELDVGLTYAWNENTTLRLQHARYDPGAATTDPRIRKSWITFTWKY